MNRLLIKEIFYSLQGEGARAGSPSIFIRLAGCNLHCWYCDTDWKESNRMDLSAPELLLYLKQYDCRWIVWTGGEPTLQLTFDMVSYFKMHGYKQAIETNGTNVVPSGLDFISVSPKVDTKTLIHNFYKVNEFRYVVGMMHGEPVFPPSIYKLPCADFYYVSPLFLGQKHHRLSVVPENVQMAINFVKKNPKWRLSVQQQKIWGIP